MYRAMTTSDIEKIKYLNKCTGQTFKPFRLYFYNNYNMKMKNIAVPLDEYFTNIMVPNDLFDMCFVKLKTPKKSRRKNGTKESNLQRSQPAKY